MLFPKFKICDEIDGSSWFNPLSFWITNLMAAAWIKSLLRQSTTKLEREGDRGFPCLEPLHEIIYLLYLLLFIIILWVFFFWVSQLAFHKDVLSLMYYFFTNVSYKKWKKNSITMQIGPYNYQLLRSIEIHDWVVDLA